MKDFDDVVCHCAGITKGDVFRAVMLGARSIKDVRTVTVKLQEGMCEEKNPSGVSCQGEFEREIEDSLRILRIMESGLRGYS